MCNGSTTDSDSVCLGSNPSSAAKCCVVLRGVAQFGRVLRSGRRGRRFKSCHLDQYLVLVLPCSMRIEGAYVRKKSFLVITLVFAVSVAVFSCFLFNGNKTYKAVEVNGKTMKAHVKGSGDKTIVMLSGWGTDSPVDDFFTLYDRLGEDYKVVVLEYFGYFGSDVTSDERTNAVMVGEIRTALRQLSIEPPYILMPHSMSGLYSLYYASNYPSEVLGIIGIDMSLPQKQLERWTEETFEKTKINRELSDLNISMINQWNRFYDNSKELKDVRYPSNLPVLAFLATEQINFVNDMIKSGAMKTSWLDINRNMITNSDLQTIQILEGEHYLHHSQADEIVIISKEFIEGKLK